MKVVYTPQKFQECRFRLHYESVLWRTQKYNGITMFDKVICGPHLFAQLEFDPSNSWGQVQTPYFT